MYKYLRTLVIVVFFGYLLYTLGLRVSILIIFSVILVKSLELYHRKKYSGNCIKLSDLSRYTDYEICRIFHLKEPDIPYYIVEIVEIYTKSNIQYIGACKFIYVPKGAEYAPGDRIINKRLVKSRPIIVEPLAPPISDGIPQVI